MQDITNFFDPVSNSGYMAKVSLLLGETCTALFGIPWHNMKDRVRVSLPHWFEKDSCT